MAWCSGPAAGPRIVAMSSVPSSSRRRFGEYLRERRERIRSRANVLDGFSAEEKDQKSRRTRSFFMLFRAFWRLLGEHRPTLIASLGTLSVATVIGLAMPASTKVVIDYVLTDNPGPSGLPGWVPSDVSRRSLLWMVGGVLVGLSTVSIVVGMWGRWQTTRLTKRVQVGLRRRAFEHAVRLPLHRVYSLKSGGAASLLREDAGGTGELLFSLIYNPWRAVVQLTGTMIALAIVDWLLLAGALLLLPAIWITHRTWIARIRPVYKDIRGTRQGLDAHTTEVFGGMRVVRAFGREAGESGSFVRTNHLMARQEILAWWWSRAIDVAWQALIPLASVGVLVYGGLRVLEGSLTIGDVMMFTAYLLMLLGPLETLASTATSVQTNLAGFDRVLDLFDEPREFEKGGAHALRAIDPAAAQGRISLEGLSFAYPKNAKGEPGPFVLRDIDLDVAAGEVIALVGPSGAGKTTLCNLIARFYDATNGVVRFDGVDLTTIETRSYRALLGVVEQDVFLFDGSVADNIRYARPGASEAEMREAALAANAAEFIEGLPKGYGTLVGERGVRLSGGQKQRIAIARALLADPRILILDEATSNLDAESEALIQESLATLMRGRTCFVIAHRLSTVRNADRIVVLEAGRVVEAGSHEELLRSGGRYASLLNRQLNTAGGPAGSASGADDPAVSAAVARGLLGGS